jgi:hypothetical protein
MKKLIFSSALLALLSFPSVSTAQTQLAKGVSLWKSKASTVSAASTPRSLAMSPRSFLIGGLPRVATVAEIPGLLTAPATAATAGAAKGAVGGASGAAGGAGAGSVGVQSALAKAIGGMSTTTLLTAAGAAAVGLVVLTRDSETTPGTTGTTGTTGTR